jgi:hypothetical protein
MALYHTNSKSNKTKKITMKEIYADFNNIAENGCLYLTCFGSIESIRNLDTPLENGEEICLSDGEVYVHARVYKCADDAWEARSSWAWEYKSPNEA